MTVQDAPPSGYFAAREKLLSFPTRDRELGFRDVRRAGWALGGDPNDLSMFGLTPLFWYFCGIRMIGRTAVEMTRDLHADFIARSVAETLAPFGAIPDVIDAFAGSGNLLFHVARALRAQRIVGLDATAEVMERTQRNFRRLRRLGKIGRSTVELYHRDWSAAPDYSAGRPTLFILAPPWGNAFSEKGLDLSKTSPPVLEILDTLAKTIRGAPTFALVQTHPLMIEQSVQAVRRAYDCFPSKYSTNPQIASRVDYLLIRLSS
ncbi:MAG: class I SAM-dependent methyltransferase [Pseudomonadota bacterium]